MKQLLFISSLACSSVCYAQSAANESDSVNHRWEIGIAYNSVQAQMNQYLFDTWQVQSTNHYAALGDKHDKSYSVSVLPKYYIKNDLAFRIELGFTAINLNKDYNAVGDTLSQNQGQMFGLENVSKVGNIKQKIYRFIPGVEYTFLRKKFLTVYAGADFVFLFYDKVTWRDSVSLNDIPGRSTTYFSETPGGIATGAGVRIGLRAEITKRIAIGCEFTDQLLYYNLGGKQTGTMHYYYPNGTELDLSWSINNNSSKGVQFTKIIPSIHISARI